MTVSAKESRADRRKAELNAGSDARLDILLPRVDVLGKAAIAGNGTQHRDEVFVGGLGHR